MVLAKLDMENFGKDHGMDPQFSTDQAQADPSVYFWRWHYRTSKVQKLFEDLIDCWISSNYGTGEDGARKLAEDYLAQGWWRSMTKHIPSLRRSLDEMPEWAGRHGGTLTPTILKNV